MITVSIEEVQIEKAKKLYGFNALRGSITKGKSNIYGALGEVIVSDYFNNMNVEFKSTYDYDMIINGYKVDVKTKHTTVTPKENYNCSISSFNTRQKCDYYFFLRINKNLKEAYMLGYIKKDEFFKKAVFNKKGELDINGWSFKDDCYNLEIKYLQQFKHKQQ